MENKNTESAVDIIYSLRDLLERLEGRLAASEASNKMLEQKLNSVIQKLNSSVAPAPAPVAIAAPVVSVVETKKEQEPESEVMDIVTQVAPKKKPQDNGPFSFKPQAPPAPPVAASPDNGVTKLPYKEVDLNPSLKPAQNQTQVIIRGRLKERDGQSVSGVEVKVFDASDICIKKTKTAATGEWLAMLPPADYTIEFSKPGMKPLLKTITVIPGRREMDVLV
jgi:hypothetical protein